MVQCAKFKEAKFSKEEEKMYENMNKAYKLYNDGDIFRLLATGQGKKGRRSFSEWRSWAETMLNSSFDDITLADTEYLLAKSNQLQEATKAHVFTDGKSAKEMIIKMMTLPADLANYHGMGRHHEIIADASAEREFRSNSLETKIRRLEHLFDALSSSSMYQGSKVIAEHNQKIETANAKWEILKQRQKRGEKVGMAELSAAQHVVDKAYEGRTNATKGENADKSAKLLRAVAENLDGQITDKQLLAIVGDGIKFESVKTLIEETKELTTELQEILQSSSKEMYEMVKLDLTKEFGEEEAASLAESLTHFETVEKYYPHKNLVTLMSRVKNIMETKRLSNEANPKETIRELARKATTAHVKKRTAGAGNIDYNVLSVLRGYGREVYDHAFAARVGHTSQVFIDKLFSLDTIAGKPDTSAEVLYANSVKTVVQSQMNQMFDRRMATWADEAMGTITAFQVLTKLTAPSTSLTNRVEGVLQYMSYNGLQNMNRAKKLISTYDKEIKLAMDGAGIEFDSKTGHDPLSNMANDKQLIDILTKEDLADMNMDSSMEVASALNSVRGGMAWLSNKAFTATRWTAAENANRKEAFQISAAEAAHFVINKWQGKFMNGLHTEYLVDHYKLDRSLAEKAKGKGRDAEPARKALWDQFRNKYIMRQGYRGMFQTQFQYSESARNFMDRDAKTSWITMFQHYPRSLGSTLLWAMKDVKSIYEVGGVEALGRRRTGKTFGGGQDDGSLFHKATGGRQMNDSLQHFLTLGGMASIKAAVRGLTGWQLTNALSMPAAALLNDLYQYFVDDEPDTKKEKAYDLLFGYDQPIRQFTGPAVSDALDISSWMLDQAGAFSMAATMSGMNDGTLPEHIGAALGLAGLKPTEEALTNKGRRQYTTAFDVLREHTLNAFSVKTRGTALVGSVIARDTDQIGTDMLRLFGIRKDWDAVRKISNERKTKDYDQ